MPSCQNPEGTARKFDSLQNLQGTNVTEIDRMIAPQGTMLRAGGNLMCVAGVLI